jgi:flagellar FliJ protein
MTRTQRMAPVQKVMDGAERESAQALAAAQRRVAEAEARQLQLQEFLREYQAGFARRAQGGLPGNVLRDYQLFLAKLQVAVDQQVLVVSQVRAEQQAATQQWQQAAQKAKALGKVIERWQGEEARAVDRRDQQDTDERALRAPRQAPEAL